MNQCNGSVPFIEDKRRYLLPVSIDRPIPQDKVVVTFTIPQGLIDEFLIQSLEEYGDISRIMSPKY